MHIIERGAFPFPLFFFFSVMRSTSFYVEFRDTYILLAHIRRLICLSPRLIFFGPK